MKEELIRIGLNYRGRTYDLQIPRQISLRQLTAQLPDALEVVGVHLPSHFHLFLLDKAIEIDPQDPLADYSVGNSDQFKVVDESEEDNGGN